MKIALLTYSTKPRGSVIHTLELANALHHLDHSVTVFALDKDGTGFDYPLSCEAQFIPAKPASGEIDKLIYQRIQEFVSYLEQSQQSYDCYHAQDCLAANALLTLFKQGKIPHFVRTVHHIDDYSSIYLQQCQDRSIREASLCLCVSDRVQSELQQHYQINAPRVINGVNLNRFSPNGASLKFDGSPIYLTIGGIEPRKNSIRLLQAFNQVRVQFPKARLIIAGGATLFDYQSYRDEFFAIAQSLNLENAIILTGVLSDAELSALYRSADAFVFPSVKEGWGLVILEAIASGLPVITSNQAPFTEFLNDRQALLVDPYSVDAIAQSMCSVFQSADSLRLQSQSILSQYSWETSAKQHIHYYQTLLYA
ncbi:MSMEG_0565 family glycosyltransferase [Leptolyngbya sp. NIES-2104]|uniref:MSMEG_0565 family glycosyltransferase n=1 Tax=Leptolyngbya sp. NIES-2104 TaxID=1552121 RepID=UPI0006ECA886|nr:MSMEG_0565 family glycosyltransferase [Leptolyngbya sp. NIES-2104]GAP96792.1 glycosyltransferase [Leptolyngbya sp. NIES-2104]